MNFLNGSVPDLVAHETSVLILKKQSLRDDRSTNSDVNQCSGCWTTIFDKYSAKFQSLPGHGSVSGRASGRVRGRKDGTKRMK